MRRLLVADGGCSAQGTGRHNNEDSYFLDPHRQFYIVADGMGGHRAGEVASRLACQLLAGHLAELCDRDIEPPDVADRVRRAFGEVNELILAHRGNDHCLQGMGTTAVAALMFERRLYVAALGDSRAYLLRNGQLAQLTVDHTLTQGLIDVGALSPQQAKTHPYRNTLWKYLGCKEIGDGADVKRADLQPGDRLLLATDGLTDCIAERTLAAVLARGDDPHDVARRLVRTAVDSGSTDDTTGVTVFFHGEGSKD